MLVFFDIILVILLSAFVTLGLYFGLIHTFGALVGVVLGSWMAGHYFLPIAGWISSIIGFSHNAINVAVFIVIFILVARLVALIFWKAKQKGDLKAGKYKLHHALLLVGLLVVGRRDMMNGRTR